MIKVAVVILNWNGQDFLKKFLPNVIKYTLSNEHKVYVADNGSNDGSIDYLKTMLEEKYIIRFDKNYGFALGYAKALEQIEAEYYVLLNSDVEVTENWITSIIEMMENDSNIAACMPKILAHHNKGYFEYAGASGGYLGKYGYPYCRGRILTEIEKDEGQYDNIVQVFWATGACLFIKAACYKKVGGLDGDFFAHMEEIDLCWRLNNAGLKVMVYPKVHVFHVGGGTLPNNNPRKLYLNFRNSLFMLYKNLPDKKFTRKIVFRLMLDGVAAIKFLFAFQFSFFLAVIKAHISFWRNIDTLKKKRKTIRPLISENPSIQISKNFILRDFFLKQKRKYSQL